jgi:hypothetical protein
MLTKTRHRYVGIVHESAPHQCRRRYRSQACLKVDAKGHNKTYKIGAGGLISSQLGTTTVIYGDPRVVGVQLRARFGRSGER